MSTASAIRAILTNEAAGLVREVPEQVSEIPVVLSPESRAVFVCRVTGTAHRTTASQPSWRLQLLVRPAFVPPWGNQAIVVCRP
jgi:hypothetical protein